jgi:hypothetical protein
MSDACAALGFPCFQFFVKVIPMIDTRLLKALMVSTGILLGTTGCVATGEGLLGGLGHDCRNVHEVRTAQRGVDFAPGQVWKTCSGYESVFQSDGNLVVYNPGRVPVWNSGTSGRGATRLSLQPDGNLVIYALDRAIWSSNTPGNPGARLAMQGDGNVVLYNVYGTAVWQTATSGK